MDTPTTETPEATPLSELAKKHFKDYTGEVKEAAPETPAEETVEETETTDNSTDTETEEESLEAAPEAEEGEDSTDKTTDTEEVEDDLVLRSFDELVENQEWDKEWTDSLTLNVKIDGEEKPVSITELRDNYQIQNAAEKRLNEAKEIKESAKAEVAQQQEAIQQNLVQAAAIIEQAEKALAGDIEKTNFDELEKIDPGEAALQKQKFQERQQTLAALKQSALAQYQQAVSQNQEEAQQVLAQTLQEEGQKLIEKIPEWANEETAKAEKASVTNYLMGLGFSEEEIAQAYDHRMIVLARKAMLHDDADSKLEPARKKLKVVKKTIAPGKQKSTSQLTQERQTQKRAQLKKSGRFEDALSLLKGT